MLSFVFAPRLGKIISSRDGVGQKKIWKLSYPNIFPIVAIVIIADAGFPSCCLNYFQLANFRGTGNKFFLLIWEIKSLVKIIYHRFWSFVHSLHY
jgi:hypothetical protein